MVKIFIDPGHGGSDPGAQGNGLQEKRITLQIAQRIREILLDEYEDVLVRMSRTGDQTVSLNERTNAANNWGADFYLSVHVNAGGGRGFESYVYPNVGSPTTTYQQRIHEEVLKLVNFQNRGRKQSDFHVLRETSMDAVLTENGFIDNRSDASILRSSTQRESIARGHVNGLVRALNLKRKPNQTPPSSGSVYRVQIGAFKDQANANQLADQARKKQFPTYIYDDKGLFRVQIGAFTDRGNAEQLASRAKNDGFEVFIRTS